MKITKKTKGILAAAMVSAICIAPMGSIYAFNGGDGAKTISAEKQMLTLSNYDRSSLIKNSNEINSSEKAQLLKTEASLKANLNKLNELNKKLDEKTSLSMGKEQKNINAFNDILNKIDVEYNKFINSMSQKELNEYYKLNTENRIKVVKDSKVLNNDEKKKIVSVLPELIKLENNLKNATDKFENENKQLVKEVKEVKNNILKIQEKDKGIWNKIKSKKTIFGFQM